MDTKAGVDLVVERISTPREFEAVKEIYRSQKATLGFLPDGAFAERFAKGQIYACSVHGAIVGYLLFSINGSDEIRIAHLATSASRQRSGVAGALVGQLKCDFAHCSRIRLNCRADFTAAAVWPRLGFVACKRIPGKKTDGSELIVYQCRLNDNPLFELLEVQSDVPKVVCDAQVCIDIENPDRPNHEAARGLMADWLIDEIDLRVTEEIFNDFDRQLEAVRNLMRSAVRSNWKFLVADVREIDQQQKIIRGILGKPKCAGAASDQRHLAIAAAGGASAFVTRDQELLDAAPEILNQSGLRVQRPSELITEVDSVVRQFRVQYRELKKTGIERAHVQSLEDVEVDQFLKSTRGEAKLEFRAVLDGMLSRPDRWSLQQIRSDAGQSLALFAVERGGDHTRRIERMRLSHRLYNTRLGHTLIDYIAHQPLGAWNSGETRVVEITDTRLCPEIAAACLRRGFTLVGDRLWRLSLPGFWEKEPLIEELHSLSRKEGLPAAIVDQLVLLANASESSGDKGKLRRLERLIHPGKLSFGDLPTYIIPIQPEWAQELFDFRIWRYGLFAPETDLVINPDSVYYKKPRNSPAGDHARVLWYVSGSAKNGGNRIRACSLLTKRVSGPVKNLYREYERMGVFDWPQLMSHFKSADAQATALEFTDTELLLNPISFDHVNALLQQSGMKPQQFMSAVKIPAAAFQKIYQQTTSK